MGDITPRAGQWLAAGSAQLPLLTPRPRPLPRPRGCFAKMGGGGEGEARLENMLFFKNPHVCTDAPLPGKLRSRALHRGGPGESGPGPAPLCAGSPGGRSEAAEPARPPSRSTHSGARAAGAGSGRCRPARPRGVQLLPGAARARARRGAPRAAADGRWRFNTAPPGTWALAAPSLSPFLQGKESHRKPERLRSPSPACIFCFVPFLRLFSLFRGERRRRGPVGLRLAACVPPQAGAGVTVCGVRLGQGPRVQSGHSGAWF